MTHMLTKKFNITEMNIAHTDLYGALAEFGAFAVWISPMTFLIMAPTKGALELLAGVSTDFSGDIIELK